MKNIQDNINKYLILNQADNIQLQALAGKMADDLIPLYEKIGICQLNADFQLTARKKPIAAIILAAGGASRFGKTKQLNIWREKTYTENVVIAAQLAGLSPIIVVTGYQHESLKNILNMYPVQTVFNPDWQKGQSTSMKVGLEHLGKRAQGALFLMADQPQVSISLIRVIVEQSYLTDRQVIGPVIDGKRSTPMYFDRGVFPELMKVEGDQGGRSILSMYPPLLVEWFDTRMAMDIDFVTDINYLTTIE
jgi:molybdenum cofactor cytidylyltransferase